MNTTKLIEDVNILKERLEQVEASTQEQMKKFENYEREWKLNDEKESNLLKENGNKTITFNVCGEKFSTRIKTVMGFKHTLLYNLVLSNEFDLSKEIYLDRSPSIFAILLEYMRYKNISYSTLSTKTLYNLMVEADYFEVNFYFYLIFIFVVYGNFKLFKG